MFNFIIKGGPVMIPILIGSLFGFAIAIERFIVFRKTRLDTFRFVEEIFKNIKLGNMKKALELCEKSSHPLANIFKIGIERRGLPLDRLEKIMEQAGNNHVYKLEKRLGALLSIVSIEPLMGFLGTITWLIRAFMTWE